MASAVGGGGGGGCRQNAHSIVGGGHKRKISRNSFNVHIARALLYCQKCKW